MIKNTKTGLMATTAVIYNDAEDDDKKADGAKANADKEKADAAAKADADAGMKLDKILSCMDSLNARMDAYDAAKADAAKADAEEDDKKADGEEDEPKEVVADKKKADGDMPEQFKKDSDDDDKKADTIADASAKVAAKFQGEIERLEKLIPKQRTDKDYAAMADVQARADTVFQAFGDSAPRPLDGEDLGGYRRRLAGVLKTHSPQLKSVNLGAIFDAEAFDFMEGQIYNDAMAAALKPVDLPAGHLREIKTRDVAGRNVSTFVGEPRAWMSSHQGQRRRVTGIRNETRA